MHVPQTHCVQEPLVLLVTVRILDRSHGVCNALNCVNHRTGKVVRRIGLVLVTKSWMRGVNHTAIHDRIAHAAVLQGHSHVCPDTAFQTLRSSSKHLVPKTKILVKRSVLRKRIQTVLSLLRNGPWKPLDFHLSRGRIQSNNVALGYCGFVGRLVHNHFVDHHVPVVHQTNLVTLEKRFRSQLLDLKNHPVVCTDLALVQLNHDCALDRVVRPLVLQTRHPRCLRRRVVHVGLTFADHLETQVLKLLEVVGGVRCHVRLDAQASQVQQNVVRELNLLV